ncbi:MAG: alkyl sulfatase dimerization domain-containing protein [Actinomycetota bacterium]
MTTRSFEPDDSLTVTAPNGARVHRDHLAQGQFIARRLHTVRDGVWCLVGNGLSNQTFIDAPGGIIAIDTGESVEEMRMALAALRTVSQRPVAAVVYSHFHYVEGTQAVLEEGNCVRPLPVYGHPRISGNKARAAGEIGPAYGRGLVEQFSMALPADGPDGNVNVGLGFDYRNPAHAPFTPGYLPVTHEISDGEVTIAGMRVLTKWSPSDADDTVNLYFPSIGTCVHNTVWPALFNVFAIRGEEYRDPRVLITGVDNIIAWGPEHLVGAHGEPISGAARVAEVSTRYRDSIQFLWDQTVRGLNKGWTADEIAQRVTLPALYDEDYLTSERYGLAEHHVRQICAGLRGWFDGDEAKLFPLHPAERNARLIAGFGGRATVAQQAAEAFDSGDLRWGLELAAWLVRSEGAVQEERDLLARGLRLLAERTPAANIRSWALTRARHLDRSGPMDRYYGHTFGSKANAHTASTDVIRTLRVLVDPAAAEGRTAHVCFVVDGEAAGLHLRNCVAVPTDGREADATVTLTRRVLLSVLGGKVAWPDAEVEISGDPSAVETLRGCLDHAMMSAGARP